jgi:DNA topoisomerase-3
VANYLNEKYVVISVGRVMTCVLGMIVRREREIRNFVKTPFYRVLGKFALQGRNFEGEWKAVEGTPYFQSPLLYKENGFLKREDAEKLQASLEPLPKEVEVLKAEKKKELKNAPLLYNLAELQNECSKMFKISPDETLRIVQELYEKKLVTYPRTDARVLSTAVSKEIYKNISGLRNYPHVAELAQEVLEMGSYKKIASTKYVNDKQITDHYAIIPTGQGLNALKSVSGTAEKYMKPLFADSLAYFIRRQNIKK